ncbi:MAG TPA: type II secretion system protein [Candidatus Paceibacterota bacterium]|nr:type II secretion system protein [Candidatus Paceibacterota bacterium]
MQQTIRNVWSEPSGVPVMKAFYPNSSGRETGFAIHELVVVIAVIFLLAGLHIAAARGGGQRTRVGQCAANLRQFHTALQIYASENRDRLPTTVAGISGVWLWDMPVYPADVLLGYGMEKRTFYCPGTSPRFDDNLNYQNAGMNSLWNFGASGLGYGFRVIGYAVALDQTTLISTNRNTSMRPSVSTAASPVQPDSDRVLVADATISEIPAGTPAVPGPAGSFVTVAGGFPVPHLSPHLKGSLPAGGNLAFKDGHVDWRDFSKMSQRVITSSSSRGFWW